MKSEKELYSEIEHRIITWSIDGTKTAGSLTRELMQLLGDKKTDFQFQEEAYWRATEYNCAMRRLDDM